MGFQLMCSSAHLFLLVSIHSSLRSWLDYQKSKKCLNSKCLLKLNVTFIPIAEIPVWMFLLLPCCSEIWEKIINNCQLNLPSQLLNCSKVEHNIDCPIGWYFCPFLQRKSWTKMDGFLKILPMQKTIQFQLFSPKINCFWKCKFFLLTVEFFPP